MRSCARCRCWRHRGPPPRATADDGSSARHDDLALPPASAVRHDAAIVADPHDLALDHDLRRAVANADFRVVYQPIVTLADRRAVAVEALLRWGAHGDERYGPDEFIGAAEQSGLIVPLGTWVLERALAEVAPLGLAGPVVTLNVSVRQLDEPTLVDDIAHALAHHRVRPDRVAFEITETLPMRDPGSVRTVLDRIRALGCRVGIDDFGTGHSTLRDLHRLTVDFIKIDRSFVAGLGTDGTADGPVQAIVALGRALGIRVVAEGVETEVQRTRLLDLGCDLAQGHLFARPQPTLAAAIARA